MFRIQNPFVGHMAALVIRGWLEVGRGAGNEGGFLNLGAGEGGEKKNSKAKSLKRKRNTKGFLPQHE